MLCHSDHPPIKPGHMLARGVLRMLRSLDHSPMTEFVPTRGLRVDVVSIGPKGEIWVVECKSSRADFVSDRKWQGYLEWCDRYFWAVDAGFPSEVLPECSGLILADAYGADIIRMPEERRLAPGRRNKLTRQIARASIARLQVLTDPDSFNGAEV
ncbi:MmcB family DNA repair protein [Paracoccus sp. Z330]|uniref:MmcB family DNA repair protein n=1 Tax=Paracoccus onchidii TaxID=3017813 RepID=A0ABT4ZGW5_9RHOB|nr:MmcB family DNA repair protein [Paracoccus onchidii]MDB6178542.1 MmcB family DNA repair protein [Paracoccus onchidii]